MMEYDIDNLLDRAVAARERAYAPYSHFLVGATSFLISYLFS
jgi:cytidine deaminase